ncbi:MAG: SurA N-terminal domain-containing protein [Desulfobacterales bacterium]|nr:SurA N-terminal domain-containing protein [Desulfobacterales bacterium]
MGAVTKRLIPYGVMALLVMAVASCGKDATDGDQKVLATVNDYRMTLDDFHRQLNAELEFTPEVKLTREVRKHFLEELIRKELMIQEAKRRGLDSEPDFVRAIERYWESTLIRKLIEIKGAEIEARTLISEDEIAAQYRNLQKVDANLPPMEEMRNQLTKHLKEEKKTLRLQTWINGLWERSRIEIDEDLMQGKP